MPVLLFSLLSTQWRHGVAVVDRLFGQPWLSADGRFDQFISDCFDWTPLTFQRSGWQPSITKNSLASKNHLVLKDSKPWLFLPCDPQSKFFFKAFPCWHFPVSIFVSLWMSAADGMVCAIKLTSIQVFIMSGKTDIWWEFFFSNHQARHFSSGVSGKPIISRCLTGHRPLSLKIL